MKGLRNRQKMVVRPRETVEKFVGQQKTVQRGKHSGRRNIQKGHTTRGK